MTVAFDVGKGIEGAIIEAIVERSPIKPIYLYKEPDGRFPNHEANPLKHETLKTLQETIVREGAALGFAYDGDADRVGLVDETGAIVPGDLITALLAPIMLKRFPGGHVVYDVGSSRIVKETVELHGGVPVESRVGRTLIIEEIRKHDAIFGGELSCHFYFRDLYGFESGDLVLLEVLKHLSESGKKLSELTASLRKYHKIQETNFEVEDKDAALRRIEQAFAAGASRVSKLDGLKIEFPDWWFVVRKSNTEPLLRLNLEADTEALMREKLEELSMVIRGD
jgi:phosphomannomutase